MIPRLFPIASEDDEPFTFTNRLQNNEVAALGPLYLVWDNIGSKALLERALDMPLNQVHGNQVRDSFLNMYPPPESPLQVQRGLRIFASIVLRATRLIAKAAEKRRNSIIRSAWSNTSGRDI